MGNNIKRQDLDLSLEEERDIIELIALKINIKKYKHKTNKELLQSIKENKGNKIQSIKENKGNQKQSKNKERIDIIREELKDLSYKLPRIELKEIKKNLYNIEKRKQFESEKTKRYLDELDKKNT